MRTVALSLRKVLVACVVVATLIGCKDKSGEADEPTSSAKRLAQSTSEYLVAHSSVDVSRLGPIFVELREMLPESIPEDVIRVDDGAIRGTIVRRSDHVLEFVPSQPMPSNATLSVLVQPSRLGIAGALGTSFEIQTREMDAFLEIDQIRPAEEGGTMEVLGAIQTADSVDSALVESALSISGVEQPSVQWQHRSGTEHLFSIRQIPRKDDDYSLDISFDATKLGGSQIRKRDVVVSGRLNFTVRDVRMIRGERPFVEVYFSDVVDQSESLDGLIRVIAKNDVPIRLDVDANVVRIYPVGNWPAEATLSIESSLSGSAKRSLKEPFTQALYLRQSRPPAVRFTTKGAIAASADSPSLAFETAGLRALRVEATRVDRERLGQFLQVNTWKTAKEMHRVGRSVSVQHYKLNRGDSPDGWDRHQLDLTKLIGEEPTGLYRLKVSYDVRHLINQCGQERVTLAEMNQLEQGVEGEHRAQEASFWDMYGGSQGSWYEGYRNRTNPCHWGYYQHNRGRTEVSKNFILSQHGIIAKSGTNGEFFIAVTDLKTARPVPNATVEVFDYQQGLIATGTSDADGMLALRPKGTPFIVRTQLGDDFGILRTNSGDALVYSHFEIAGSTSQKGLKGYIFGERDVWRPGDTVYLTSVVYDVHHQLPASVPATLVLKSPAGEKVYTATLSKSDNGFYHWPIPTESHWRTGFYTATVRIGNAKFSRPVKLEMIKPNRIEVALTMPEAELEGMSPVLASGLKATWLHGAPASGLKADVSVALTSKATTFPKFSDYQFVDITRPFTFNGAQSPLFNLDINGETKVEVPFDVGRRPPGKLKATFTTRVYEESGGFSISTNSADLSPFERYVGIKTPKGDAARGMLLTDQDHPVDIVVVDKDGNPLPTGEVEVSLYKVGWKWWWEKGYDDLADYTGRRSVRVLSRGKVSVADGKASWPIRVDYPSWGRYLLVAKDLNGTHQSSKVIYMDWPGWAGKARKDAPGGANVLSLVTDRKTYEVGDTVQLTIPSRSGANILVSIERGESRLSSKWIQATGDRTLHSFVITSGMAPGVYLNVTQVVPTDDWQASEPLRMYGVVPIDIVDPKTVLKPVLDAPQEAEPNSSVAATVSEQDGQPMTYMLALVDEGLLNLTNFKTPNPHDSFYRRESFGMRNWDIYGDIIGADGFRFGTQISVGGGEDGAESSSRRENRFPSLVEVQGPFALAANERREHSVEIPSYIGKGRWMVIAGDASSGRFGQSESSMTIKKSLMVLTTLPRLVGTGEQFSVPVTLFVDEEGLGTVDVKLKLGPGLRYLGDSESAQLKFKSPGNQMVTFNVEAEDNAGQTEVEVIAEVNGVTSRSRTAFEIRPVTPWSSTLLTATIDPGKTWALEESGDFITGSTEMGLEISRIGNLGIERRLNELVRYPHGCLEQTVSKIFPQLYLTELVDLTDDQAARVASHVSEAMRKLKQFQNAAGGFSYWQVGDTRSHYSSLYAGHFLLEAERLGYYWEPEQKQRFVKFEKSQAQVFGAGSDKYSSFLQAYRLYLLALAGSAEFGAMNRLKSFSPKGLTGLYLSAAYLRAGETSLARDLFAKVSKEDGVIYGTETGGSFHSPTRDLALELEIRTIFDATGATELAKKVQDTLKSGRAWNTQETSQMLRALSMYLSKQTSEGLRAEVNIDGVKEEITSPRAIARRESAKAGALSIVNTSDTPIFANVRLSGYPRPEKSGRQVKGLSVDVSYKAFDGEKKIDPFSMKQGTDFEVTIRVANKTVQNVENIALTHLVPSGWEILDRPSKKKLRGIDLKDIRDDRVLTYFRLKPNETKMFKVRLHAAYLGSYFLAPIRAEAMYDASIYGQSSADFTEVVRPRDAF